MAIAPLPSATTHLLGSSVVITDSTSIIKELLDNGIDAGATSIEVLISQNTVDKIQVKDNGHGISFDNLNMLGRLAHTSKLRTFDELEDKARDTLGFRGIALASANSMATVKIITKTAQDPIGTSVWLKPGVGGAEKEQSVAAPVGTTVQALRLFENLPVRKQNAMRESRKSLSNIKRLLESYALTLPQLRLSFKVIGEPNQMWTYSPPPLAESREAVTQIFGNHLMAHCIEVITSLEVKSTGAFPGSTWGTLTALLPKVDCPLALVKDKGFFISVDSRPILSSRGTGKKLASIFKRSLSGTFGSDRSTRAVSSPFMRLAITCNKGSYDPNVTPLKDEVLFKDEPAILDCFQNLCDRVYKSEGSNSREWSFSASNPRNVGGAIRLSKNNQHGEPVTSRNLGSPDGLEEDFLTEDKEFPEDLNDIQLKKPPGPINNSSSEAHYSGNVETQQELTQEKPVGAINSNEIALMRTIIKVNLARKDSNTSDECSTMGLVPAHVAQHRTASPAVTEAASCPSRKDPTLTHQRETIHHYFLPKRDQPIEIALDETATSGNIHDQEESNLCDKMRQHENGRQPLRELTSSISNILTEGEEGDEQTTAHDSSGDLSSPEPDILRTTYIPRGNLNLSSLRERGNTTADRHDLSTLTPLRRLLEPIARRERRNSQAVHSLQGVGSPNSLQSPPRSDTVHPGQAANSRSQIFGARNERGQSAMVLGGGRTERRTERSDLRQTAVSNRDGLRRGRNGVQVHASRNAASLLDPTQSTRSNLVELNQVLRSTLYGSNGAQPPENQDECSDQATQTWNPNQFEVSLQAASQHGDCQSTASATRLNSSYRGAQWPHLSQALPMRTPRPADERSKLRDQSEESGYQDHQNRAQMCDTPFPEARPIKRRCSRPQNESSIREVQDPRRYYMKGRNLRTLSGKPKRLPSVMLPLEKVPPHQETQRLLATVESGLNSLERARWEYITWENESQAGRISFPLLFRDLGNVLGVEGRLKKAVNLWLGGKDETVVVYTMQSEAKGKWTA